MPFDGNAFGDQIVSAVKSHVSRELAPILSRLEALEARAAVPGPKGEDGRDGADGRDAPAVTVDDIRAAVAGMEEAIGRGVAQYLENNPPPAGRDGQNGKNGADGRDGTDGRDGERGADGIGLAGAFINRGGELVVTLTNGEAKPLGPVVGRDGDPGAAGQDGADGLGFDDMAIEHDGGRNIVLRWSRGEVEKRAEISFPVVMDAGVFSDGKSYQSGDGVTWGGSYWIALEDTTERPGDSKAWRLAVRRGRDGKESVRIAHDPASPVKV